MEENFTRYLAVALEDHKMRRACTAVEHILCAAEILDDLPAAALELIRDHCDNYVKGRTGAFSDFKRAYIKLVVDHLNDKRVRERRLLQGITGIDGQE
jgi:hypothetical protein